MRPIHQIPWHRRKAAKPTRRSLYDVLNSPFAIWLLSTVAISLAGSLLAHWSQSTKEETARQMKVQRLDLEIRSRLMSLGMPGWTGVKLLAGRTVEGKQTPPTLTADQYIRQIFGPPDAERVAYEEYSKRNLLSLILELENYVEPHDKKCVSDLAFMTSSLVTWYRQEAPANVATQVQYILQGRWFVDGVVNSALRKEHPVEQTDLDSMKFGKGVPLSCGHGPLQ